MILRCTTGCHSSTADEAANRTVDASVAGSADGRPETSPTVDTRTAAAMDAAYGDSVEESSPVAIEAGGSEDHAGDGLGDVWSDRNDVQVLSPGDANPSGAGVFEVKSSTLVMRGPELVFPASACLPMDHSLALQWMGAPGEAKSFAVIFEDTAIDAVKWVVWDIPGGISALPGDLSKTVHPVELPAASQRGSLGRTGYSGPGTPMVRAYRVTIWALGVDKVPGVDGATTAELRNRVLPRYRLATSRPLVAKGKQGGL